MKERQVIVTWFTPEEKTPEPDMIVVATITGKAKGIRFNHSFALLIWTEEGWLSLDWDFEELTVHAWADLEVYGGLKNMNGKDDGLWFAVMANENDDWSIGTEDIEEAKQMLLEQGQGLIAAINGMMCMYKIYYEDIAPKGSYTPDDVEFEIYLLARSVQKLALKLGRDVDLSTLHHSYNDKVGVEVNVYVDRNTKIIEEDFDDKVRYEHIKISYIDNLDENPYKGICKQVEDLEDRIMNSK